MSTLTDVAYSPSQLDKSRLSRLMAYRSAEERPSAQGGFLLVLLWLCSYILLAVTNIWLWEAQGIISSELLYWDARQALVFKIEPAHLASLVLTDASLPFYLILLTGGALSGAAFLGATVLAAYMLLFRRMGAPFLWFLLILFHPAWLIPMVQYPTIFLRAFLLTLALIFTVSYLRRGDTFQLLVSALTLGMGVLVDPNLGILYVFWAVALVLARPRGRTEQITLLLMILFPAFFLMVAWLYLNWVQSGDPFYMRRSLYASLTNVPVWAELSPWRTTLPTSNPVGQVWRSLLLFAPGYLAALMVAIRTLRPKEWRWSFSLSRSMLQAGIAWGGLIALMLLPLLDLLLLSWWGLVDVAPLAVIFPLFSLPLLYYLGRPTLLASGIVTFLLAGGLILGWSSVQSNPNEAQYLLHSALEMPVDSPWTPFQDVATYLNEHLGPEEHVMFDHAELFPLLVLLEEGSSILLPYQVEYAVAQQEPEEWVEYIVLAHPDSPLGERQPWGGDPERRLTHFKLVLQSGDLLLYQRQ